MRKLRCSKPDPIYVIISTYCVFWPGKHGSMRRGSLKVQYFMTQSYRICEHKFPSEIFLCVLTEIRTSTCIGCNSTGQCTWWIFFLTVLTPGKKLESFRSSSKIDRFTISHLECSVRKFCSVSVCYFELYSELFYDFKDMFHDSKDMFTDSKDMFHNFKNRFHVSRTCSIISRTFFLIPRTLHNFKEIFHDYKDMFDNFRDMFQHFRD